MALPLDPEELLELPERVIMCDGVEEAELLETEMVGHPKGVLDRRDRMYRLGSTVKLLFFCGYTIEGLDTDWVEKHVPFDALSAMDALDIAEVLFEASLPRGRCLKAAQDIKKAYKTL